MRSSGASFDSRRVPSVRVRGCIDADRVGDCVRPVRARHHLGHHHRPARWCGPRRHRHRGARRKKPISPAPSSPTRPASSRCPRLDAGPLRHLGRARRLRESTRAAVQLDAACQHLAAVHARDRRHERDRHGHVGCTPAADRRRRPQDGRSQGPSSSCRSRVVTRSASRALKAGVVGGNFNNLGFAAFSNGGFNINGSRSDENNISVDGAITIRTRSAGTIIGIQNVDTLQEVQVLTANYMPEYRRASGGRESASSPRAAATATPAVRRSSCGTSPCRPTPGPAIAAPTRSRTRGRRRSTTSSTAMPSAVRFRAAKFKDKLFFYGAQEWVNFFQLETSDRHGPNRGDAARRLQRAAEREQRLLHRGRGRSSIRSRVSLSRATSSRPTACRPTVWPC